MEGNSKPRLTDSSMWRWGSWYLGPSIAFPPCSHLLPGIPVWIRQPHSGLLLPRNWPPLPFLPSLPYPQGCSSWSPALSAFPLKSLSPASNPSFQAKPNSSIITYSIRSIQESWWNPSRRNIQKITIKLPKINNKEKIFKAAEEKSELHTQN